MIIEMVGAAGTGKTTITKDLIGECPNAQSLLPPSPHLNTYRWFFTKYGAKLLWTMNTIFSDGDRAITRREFAWMIVLKGWAKELRANRNRYQEIIVLDQGPIFYITSLNSFGPSTLRKPKLSKFWTEVFNDWSQTLDLVVLLDAPDDCLTSRINTRDKEHIMKDKDYHEVFKFIDDWRLGYDQSLSLVRSNTDHPAVLRINTELIEPHQAVQLIMAEIAKQKSSNVTLSEKKQATLNGD